MENPSREETGYEWACMGCGIVFKPRWNETLKKYSRFCGTCGMKNLLRGLEISNEELKGSVFEGLGYDGPKSE